jgi:subtilisin family serine protease
MAMQPENAPDDQRARMEVHVGLIVRAYREQGIEVGVHHRPDGTLDFLHEEGVILVRDEYLGQARQLVGGEVADGLADGLTLLRVEATSEPAAAGQEPAAAGQEPAAAGQESAALAAVGRIEAALGVGVATPNHILSISPVYACPATEPEEVPAGALPDPGLSDRGGSGVFIYAPDTGLLANAATHPWLAGVTGNEDKLPPPDASGAVLIPDYAGHGTFVAGVARCMAPVAAVEVSDDFSRAGAISEHLMIKRLTEALGLGPNIISLSAGGTTRNDLPLLSFEVFWRRYRHYKGVQLVAAAGNNSSRRPFWPAAFPQVVGVGAMASNRRDRAYFSDHGPWVDVYAPGEGLVNAYATGTYVCREPPSIGQLRQFHGMARWSGTSFATPLVSGLIAARMSGTGESARIAARALLARARAQHVPGVGPVLWPSDAQC